MQSKLLDAKTKESNSNEPSKNQYYLLNKNPQGAHASSKDTSHEVFLPHLLSEQFNGGHAKYSLISYVSCAKSFN